MLSDLQVNMHDLLNFFIQTKLLDQQTDEEGLYRAIADGKISIDRLLRIIGEIGVKRRLTDEGLSKEFVRDLVKWFGDHGKLSSNREDALFLAVAKRDIPSKLLRQVIDEIATAVSMEPPPGTTMQTASEDSSRDHGLSFHAAQCCYPLPDDPIVGFVTLGHGLSVHREVCPQMDTLSKSKPKVQITWKDLAVPKNCTFSSKLFVTVAEYNPKIRRKIQDVLLKADAIIREELVVGASQIRFIVSVKDVKHLHEIRNRLKQVEGVSEICRQEQPRHVVGASNTERSEDRSDNSKNSAAPQPMHS